MHSIIANHLDWTKPIFLAGIPSSFLPVMDSAILQHETTVREFYRNHSTLMLVLNTLSDLNSPESVEGVTSRPLTEEHFDTIIENWEVSGCTSNLSLD